MIIRPASLSDQIAIHGLAMEQTKLYPFLKPDRENIRKLIVDGISASSNFCYVVEENGEVGGVLGALTSNNVWAQRQCCAIMLWVSVIPGGGAALLRAFRDWVLARRAIRVAGMAPDIDVDQRTWDLVERIGFKKRGGSYLLINGGLNHGTI